MLRAAQNELDEKITELEGISDGDEPRINSIRQIQETIQQEITELEKYVKGLDGSTRDWMDDTFATLAEYQKACEVLAEAKKAVEGLDSKLDINIAAAEQSIKEWINPMFDGYYEATDVQERLTDIDYFIKYYNAILENFGENFEEYSKELLEEVEALKKELADNYGKAIKEASETLTKEFSEQLAAEILKVNNRTATLIEKAEGLQAKADDLEKRMLTLEGNINSINSQIVAINKSIEEFKDLDKKLDSRISALLKQTEKYPGSLQRPHRYGQEQRRSIPESSRKYPV